MCVEVKNREGVLIQEEMSVRERWREHFEELLNVAVGVDDGSYEEMYEVGNVRDRGTNVRNICYEEVEYAVRKLKKGKSAGLDGVCVEMIKEGGKSMLLWLVRMFNVCWKEGKVPQDWQDGSLVPIYKGKGDKMECSNYRGISLLSVVGKLYGRVLIGRVKMITERSIGEEQGGFREGEGVWIKCLHWECWLKNIEKRRKICLCVLWI